MQTEFLQIFKPYAFHLTAQKLIELEMALPNVMLLNVNKPLNACPNQRD